MCDKLTITKLPPSDLPRVHVPLVLGREAAEDGNVDRGGTKRTRSDQRRCNTPGRRRTPLRTKCWPLELLDDPGVAEEHHAAPEVPQIEAERTSRGAFLLVRRRSLRCPQRRFA